MPTPAEDAEAGGGLKMGNEMKLVLYSIDNGKTWTEYEVEAWMDEPNAIFYMAMELYDENLPDNEQIKPEDILVKFQ